MTITQFHNALLQGKGSCILAVRSDPEKYREEVLWACRELVSFDTQCEGSRGWFIHELVSCYPDREVFIRATARALRDCPCDGGWTLFCLAELLEWFLGDGSELAWKALRFKYGQLYHSLLHDGSPDTPTWPVRDDFGKLAIVLASYRDAFLDIARDIGRLFLETEWFDGWDFDWLWHTRGTRYRKALDREARKDKYLAAYIRVHEEAEREDEARRAARPRKRLPWKCADPERLNAAMERYLAAESPEDRADALDAFHWTAYPGDPAPLLKDAGSDDEKLRHAAWMTLEHIRHPAVREFALSRLDSEPDAFGVFVANYETRDEARLMERLRAEAGDFECTTDWHAYQLDVLRMDERRSLAPKTALQFIYDTTYCSCCRCDALKQMGRRRMLTPALLEECQFDSNDDIRTYARRCINRRKPG